MMPRMSRNVRFGDGAGIPEYNTRSMISEAVEARFMVDACNEMLEPFYNTQADNMCEIAVVDQQEMSHMPMTT